MTKTQELGAWEYLAEGLRSHARTIDMECAPEDSDIWAAADALSAASATIKGLEAEREKADNALVDKYRDPKTGYFTFPDDVAAIVRRLEAAEAERDALRKALMDARTWHEEQDKALSKQPPSSGPNGNQWARLQHREQIDLIDATCKAVEGEE